MFLRIFEIENVFLGIVIDGVFVLCLIILESLFLVFFFLLIEFALSLVFWNLLPQIVQSLSRFLTFLPLSIQALEVLDRAVALRLLIWLLSATGRSGSSLLVDVVTSFDRSS